MNREQALNLLDLTEGASPQEIATALAAKTSDISAKQAAAPTIALKAKFSNLLSQLQDASDLLTGSREESSAASEPFQSDTSQTETLSRSQLSQTKLADLPGMATGDSSQIELQPGTELTGRYTIKALIGQGGMGAVYRAHDKNRDEEIAIKLLLPSLTNNERALERFLNEARISSRLSHPNIVNVYDIQNEGELYFLTMELLEGQGLDNLVNSREQLNQPFSAKELVEIIEHLAPSLDYAHQHTVHRDIKPENIWLDEDGQYKLMDFGIAQLQSTSQRTQTGAAMGTAYYMAPEQLKGSKNIDARADIYALGVLLYTLATGDVPAGVIKPLGDKRDDITQAFSDAVMQCLAADADERPASAGALLEQLLAGLTAASSQSTSTTKAKRDQTTDNPLSAKSPNWSVPITIVVVLAIIFGNLVLTEKIDLKSLLPLSQEEIAQRKAVSAKLIGEIKNYQRRLEGGRRQLDSDLRDAKRNQAEDTADELAALEHWQTLTENYLFNGTQLTELEGDLSAGEILLRDSSFELAEKTLTEVRDGYKELWGQFTAAEKLYGAEQETAKTRDRWLEDRWQARKNSYGLNDPVEVSQARNREQLASESQRSGSFVLALEHWHKAAELWRAAYSAIEKGIVQIDQQRKAQAARDKALSFYAQAQTAAKQGAIKQVERFKQQADQFDSKALTVEQWQTLVQEAVAVRNEVARKKAVALYNQASEAAKKGSINSVNRLRDEANKTDPNATTNEHWIKLLQKAAGIKKAKEEKAAEELALSLYQKAVRESEQGAVEQVEMLRERVNKADPNIIKREQWTALLITAEEVKARKAAYIKKLVGKLVKIPAGSFQMGSHKGSADEKPVHSVSIDAFKMQAHEVTWNQYQPCIDAGACPISGDRGWGKGNRPVIHVSYNHIVNHYIPWLKKITGFRFRLPSEAEWEYAARAGSSTKYSWGNSVGHNLANCESCGSHWDDEKTAPVGSFSPNAFGLYDMHGNVWEWTQDCLNDSYRGAPTNGAAWTQGDCWKRILRGGSWYDYPRDMRSASRSDASVSTRLHVYGFRLALDI